MTLLLAKVICWNSNGYIGPAGDNAAKGFKYKNGYGHEEWNNSPKLKFEKDGVKYRAFHTETVGEETVDDNAGNITICMYARKGNFQFLVGIAAQATCLIGKKTERKKLAKRLKTKSLGEAAWNKQFIKDVWDNDKNLWEDHWNKNNDWIPNWYCPVDKFIWFENPIKIDVTKITGKKLLNFNYGRHQPLSSNQVINIIKTVPESHRADKWRNIYNSALHAKDYSSSESLVDDIFEIAQSEDITETQRKSLIATRLGQGKFRTKLDNRWNNKCAVTGITTRLLLRASHIKPWRNSDNKEKLDPNNGLLLSANIDALFDKGLVTFLDTGEMKISKALEETTVIKMKLPENIKRKLNDSEKGFLKHHRDYIFKK